MSLSIIIKFKKEIKWISIVSKNTLGIYFIHWILDAALTHKVTEYTMFYNLPGCVIWSVIVMIVCLGIIAVMKKIPIIKKTV